MKRRIQNKKCRICKIIKPYTEEYFPKNGGNYLRSECRECRKIVKKEYYDSHIEEIARKQKIYRQEHSAELVAHKKQYYQQHKEKIKENRRLYYVNNKQKVKIQNRKNYIKYQEDRILYAREYRKENPEKSRIAQHKRRTVIKKSTEMFTAKDIKTVYSSQEGRCWWCQKDVGDNYHLDHRIPLSRGGSNGASNIVITCPRCNHEKYNLMPWEWVGRLL